MNSWTATVTPYANGMLTRWFFIYSNGERHQIPQMPHLLVQANQVITVLAGALDEVAAEIVNDDESYYMLKFAKVPP